MAGKKKAVKKQVGKAKTAREFEALHARHETLKARYENIRRLYVEQERTLEKTEVALTGFKNALSLGAKDLKDRNDALDTRIKELYSENSTLRSHSRYQGEIAHEMRQRLFDYLEVEDSLATDGKKLSKENREQLKLQRETLRKWLQAQWELENK